MAIDANANASVISMKRTYPADYEMAFYANFYQLENCVHYDEADVLFQFNLISDKYKEAKAEQERTQTSTNHPNIRVKAWEMTNDVKQWKRNLMYHDNNKGIVVVF